MVMGDSGGYRRLTGGSDDFSLQTDTHTLHHNIYIIVIITIIRKAMNEDRFANAPSYSNTVKAIAAFRKGLTDVVTYGHVTVPLVYTQVWEQFLSARRRF